MATRELVWRVIARVRRGSMARELEEEMRFHRELLARDLEHSGMPPRDAAAAAARRFGNALSLRERSAATWGFPPLEMFLQDLRFGARTLRRMPGFAAVAVCTTGLAIGINCAFFTLVDSLVWRPIPVADATHLVRLVTVLANRETSVRFSHPEFTAIAERARALRDVTAFAPGRVALADPTGRRRAFAVGTGFVSGNYFTALGGTAIRGRILAERDDESRAEPVVVISERLWRTAFAAVPDVVGRTVVIDGTHATIAGVIARTFIGVTPVVPDLWMPITLGARVDAVGGSLDVRGDRFLMLHGHLRDGATRDAAASEISPLVAEPPSLAASLTAGRRITGAAVLPQSSLVPLDATTARIALPGFVVVGLVLIIACANLAILLLARALGRQREVAVRMAIGASRGRVLRQMLTEGGLIAVLGAALGFVLANVALTVGAKAVIEALPISIGTVVLDLQPSPRVYLYTAALSVVSVLVFGLVPALHGTTLDLNAALKGDDRLFGLRLKRSRFRDALVTAQVAACVVLAVAAATLVGSLRESVRTDTNLHVERVQVATLGLERHAAANPDLVAARAEFAVRSQRLPGVERVARVAEVPFGGAWPTAHVAAAWNGPVYELPFNTVTPGYFDVVGQPVVRGRGFTAADSATGGRMAIVTAAAARTLWGRSDAVGQTLRVVRQYGSAPDSIAPYHVAGIVSDARSGSLYASDSSGYVYLLAGPRQVAAGQMSILIRSAPMAGDLVAVLARLASEIAPTEPFETVAVTRLLDAQVVPFRYAALVATIVGALGVALAAVGLYAVVAFSVRQRRREVAVRVAMGASARDVLDAVLRRELRLVIAGLIIGVLLALGEARLLGASGIPFSPIGLAEFAAIPVLLFVVAVLATVIPARAALHIDPMQTLRQE